MKRLVTILIGILLVLPVTTSAQVSVGWSATSTNNGFIQPNRVNGNRPFIKVPNIIATSTTATSTFGQYVEIGSADYDNSNLRIWTQGFFEGIELIEQTGFKTFISTGGDEFNVSTVNPDGSGGGDFHILNKGGYEVGPRCLGQDDDGCLKVFINNTPVMTIADYKNANKDLWGNVGISSTSPFARLTVVSTSTNPTLWLNQTGTGDIIQAWDGSSKVFTVEDGGNVGIGIANPTVPLDVIGGTDTQGGTSALQVGASEIFANNAVVRIGDVDGAGTGQYLRIEDNEFEFNNGNVGVGSTTPSARLSVKSAGTGTGRAFVVSDSANTERFTILDNGNVGIGSTSPASKLGVTGGIYATETINVNSTTDNAGVFAVSSGNTSGASLGVKSTAGTGNSWQFSATGPSNGAAYSFLFYNETNTYSMLRLEGAASSRRAIFNGTTGIAWDNGSSQFMSGTVDTSLSRGAAGKVYVGTGANGSSAGTLIADGIGAGTTTLSTKLNVYGGGIGVNPGATAKPTCSVANRGVYWHTFGGAGVKDAVEVCAKDAGDAYAWRTIY